MIQLPRIAPPRGMASWRSPSAIRYHFDRMRQVGDRTLTVMSGADDTVVTMPSPQVTERVVPGLAGLPALAASLVVMLAGAGLLVRVGWAARGPGFVLILLGVAACRGLTAVVPGEARVLQLFGSYAGT